MTSSYSRLSQALSVIVVLCLSTSCTTVRSTLYDPPVATLTDGALCGTDPATDVAKARALICKAQIDYQKAIYGASEVSDSLWTILLATGASAVGLALTGTTGNPLLATALFTSTGAVGGKLLLQPETRGAIFQAGAEATACLLSATAPLVPAETGLTSLDPLFSTSTGLPAYISQLQAANEDLKNAIAANPNDPAVPAAKQLHDAANNLVDSAQTAYIATAKLRTQMSTNVANILASLQRIRAAVSGAARSASPDLANLQGALKSIKAQTSDMIGFLVPTGPAQQAAGTAKTKSRSAQVRTRAVPSNLQDSVDRVAASVGPVAQRVAILATITPTIHVADINSSLQDCINKVQALEAPSIQPIFLQLKPGDTGSVSVSGGSGNYPPPTIQPTSTDLKVSLTSMGTKSARVDAMVSKGAATGKTYYLVISDPERRSSQVVTVEVTAGPPGLTSKSSSDSPLPAKKGSKIVFTISGGTPPYTSSGPAPDDTESVAALEVDPKGELPSSKPDITVTLTDAAKANKTYKTLLSDATGSQLSLEVKVGAATTKQSSVPIASSIDLVKRVQSALLEKGFDPGPIDGRKGPKTEAALKQFQSSSGLDPTGDLNDTTLKLLGTE